MVAVEGGFPLEVALAGVEGAGEGAVLGVARNVQTKCVDRVKAPSELLGPSLVVGESWEELRVEFCVALDLEEA